MSPFQQTVAGPHNPKWCSPAPEPAAGGARGSLTPGSQLRRIGRRARLDLTGEADTAPDLNAAAAAAIAAAHPATPHTHPPGEQAPFDPRRAEPELQHTAHQVLRVLQEDGTDVADEWLGLSARQILSTPGAIGHLRILQLNGITTPIAIRCLPRHGQKRCKDVAGWACPRRTRSPPEQSSMAQPC